MNLVLLSFAILLLILGCFYLYNRRLILQFNAFLRNNIFNDVHVLTNHRKIGVLFILISLVFFYMAIILD
ncbi:MAG: hypothetical protein GF384_09160 [Elusimicrobia bacterium]|nr:hypothetical protein [Elusimicrobiota bacterium]